ncbi:MAG: hypothetical protein LBC81_01330 [Tannerellaceae bacterium]|jgi:hypothetical protein|nr:hypothetical protein [Tannerellaceae bacterium]
MRKYEINTWGEIYRNLRNAAVKAPADADVIYRRHGFKVIRLPNLAWLDRIKIGKIIRRIYIHYLALIFRPSDEVHIQLTGSRLARRLVKLLGRRGCKLILLVHDSPTLRYGKDPRAEAGLYNSASEIIVHTPAMADALRQRGVTAPMRILVLFDYLASAARPYRDGNIGSVVFAGNLVKSGFITALIQNAARWPVDLHLYGSACPPIPAGSRIRHEGTFNPSDISMIKGAWGLVWDGDAPDACNPYLIYNSPHKLSLYLAAEKPLIVWRRSALYDFVTSNRLGIAIDTLYDIPELLASITEEAYNDYAGRVATVALQVRNGGFLGRVIGD